MDLKFPAHVSSGAKDLISKLLVKDPKQRLGLAQVFVCGLELLVYEALSYDMLRQAAPRLSPGL